MRYLKLLLLAFLFPCVSGFSQEYLEMIDEGGHSVQEIINSAEAYFENRDKGRGSGYKQFKRWEYMALRLMNEEGYLVPIEEQIARKENYDAYLNQTADTRDPLNDNWVEMGPTDWNATTGWNPGVGRITGFAVDNANTDHIIAGANTGGVWKTTDGGQTWLPLNDNFNNMNVYSVTMDPTNSDVYYFGSNGGLIFKSTDAGATWNELADLGSSLINKILINPDNTDIMFASGQNSGLYRSIDAGATWQSITNDGNGFDVEFQPGNTNVVYASGLGFHKSTDGGETFTTIGGLAGGPKMIGVSEDDPQRVYVVRASGSTFGGLYVSSDEGENFTLLNHGGDNYFGYSTSADDNSGQAPRDMDIAVNPTNADEVHIAGILTWRSTDAGVTFNPTSDWIPGNAQGQNIGYCHADVDILAFVGDKLYAGTDGGLFMVEDTDNVSSNYYTDLTAGMGIRQFYKIGVAQGPDEIITGGSQDNGTSFYTESNQWRDWLGADGMEGFVDYDFTNRMFGTSQNGRMYRTDNAGNSLIGVNEPGQGFGNWVTPFEQDPQVSATIYVGYNRVYKSTNRGQSWSAISQFFGSNLENLKIAPSDNQIMYLNFGGSLFKTTDGGSTNWQATSAPGGAINYIAIHPTNPDKIAVATTSSNRVYVSEDGGDSWVNYRKNLPSFSALCVAWDDNGANGLYVGMNYGVFYIDDTMEDWQPYSNNLPNVIVNELEINTENNILYAGTYGRGLWATPLREPDLSAEEFISETEVRVYPNPTRNNITLGVPEAVEADIRVFDIQGKLLMYLPDTAIANEMTIETASLSAGTYFVRVSSNKGTVTKKFIKK
ncbi:T9SS type A sorting domain-containing protein [Flavobacteriaceae bacterium TK19130]|nr:T9SS type A sorting domain-containing protein [Thermobacterium salinum]